MGGAGATGATCYKTEKKKHQNKNNILAHKLLHVGFPNPPPLRNNYAKRARDANICAGFAASRAQRSRENIYKEKRFKLKLNASRSFPHNRRIVPKRINVVVKELSATNPVPVCTHRMGRAAHMVSFLKVDVALSAPQPPPVLLPLRKAKRLPAPVFICKAGESEGCWYENCFS